VDEVECPNCGLEMAETHERVPAFHFPGVKARTTRDKTKLRRVYNCSKCNKKFVVGLTLREVS